MAIRLRTPKERQPAFSNAPLEEQFRRLVKWWRDETSHLSVTFRKAMHPAYQQIIGMGADAVPLILLEMEEHGGYWFWALSAITGENPTRPNSSYEEAIQSWLAWGKERRIIE
jgi:hypothetical protein